MNYPSLVQVNPISFMASSHYLCLCILTRIRHPLLYRTKRDVISCARIPKWKTWYEIEVSLSLSGCSLFILLCFQFDLGKDKEAAENKRSGLSASARKKKQLKDNV